MCSVRDRKGMEGRRRDSSMCPGARCNEAMLEGDEMQLARQGDGVVDATRCETDQIR